MGKLCKQTVESESKVMRISLVRWPPGWLLCSLTAHPNTRVLSAFTCFWLGVTAPFVALKSTRQSTQRTVFFFLFHIVQTAVTFQGWVFDKRNISRATLLEAAFVQKKLFIAWWISVIKEQKDWYWLNGNMLLKGLEEWIAHQLFCNLRAIFT